MTTLTFSSDGSIAEDLTTIKAFVASDDTAQARNNELRAIYAAAFHNDGLEGRADIANAVYNIYHADTPEKLAVAQEIQHYVATLPNGAGGILRLAEKEGVQDQLKGRHVGKEYQQRDLLKTLFDLQAVTPKMEVDIHTQSMNASLTIMPAQRSGFDQLRYVVRTGGTYYFGYFPLSLLRGTPAITSWTINPGVTLTWNIGSGHLDVSGNTPVWETAILVAGPSQPAETSARFKVSNQQAKADFVKCLYDGFTDINSRRALEKQDFFEKDKTARLVETVSPEEFGAVVSANNVVAHVDELAKEAADKFYYDDRNDSSDEENYTFALGTVDQTETLRAALLNRIDEDKDITYNYSVGELLARYFAVFYFAKRGTSGVIAERIIPSGNAVVGISGSPAFQWQILDGTWQDTAGATALAYTSPTKGMLRLKITGFTVGGTAYTYYSNVVDLD